MAWISNEIDTEDLLYLIEQKTKQEERDESIDSYSCWVYLSAKDERRMDRKYGFCSHSQSRSYTF